MRQWANAMAKEECAGATQKHEILFRVIIWVISRFGRDKPETKLDSMDSIDLEICEDYALDVSLHFGSDASLFEFGCYIYFLIDLWLYHNRLELREDIIITIQEYFCHLFGIALQIDNIAHLFDERLSKYAELHEKFDEIKDQIESYHDYLSTLISNTRDNTLPKSYKLSFPPSTLSGEFLGIKLALMTWQLTIFPTMLTSLEEYCNFITLDA